MKIDVRQIWLLYRPIVACKIESTKAIQPGLNIPIEIKYSAS